MTLDGGTRAPLARASAGGVKGPKVGQYTVMLQDFETVAVKALSARSLEKCQYVVIDEIGKMECFSTKFQSLVRKIFSSDSTHIIATVPVKFDTINLVKELVNRDDVEIIHVTKDNRDDLKTGILAKLT